MKVNELREKSQAELMQELVALRREQFNLRMQKASGGLPKPQLVTIVRKNIARIKTIMREKESVKS